MQRKVPDTAELSLLTGWMPRHSLDDTLSDAIAHARRDLAACPGLTSPRATAIRS